VIDTWQVLKDLGLPDGPPRRQAYVELDPARTRVGVREVLRELEPGRVAPLMAWLSAWRHHWSDHFDRTFGAEGPVYIRELAQRLEDPNRYLKLRRIAIANLAKLL
jgi:hypothetical protein